jgi:hypothetical protein
MKTASALPPPPGTTAAPGTEITAAPEITAGGDGPRRSPLAYLPAVAGVGYLVVWVAGLAAWPANLALNATSARVAASHQAHHTAATIQYLLVEGLAGLLLGVVLAGAVIPARPGRLVARARPAAVLAAVAVVISVGQCVLGLLLVAAATGHDISRAGDLYALVNRLDGVKMLALAGAAGYLASRLDPARVLPRWLRVTAAVTAVALVASGVTYLLLANALAGTVYVAGPLLLIWVTGTGLWLTVAARRRER